MDGLINYELHLFYINLKSVGISPIQLNGWAMTGFAFVSMLDNAECYPSGRFLQANNAHEN